MEPNRRKYFRFTLHLVGMALIDLLNLPFWVVLLMFPWRFNQTRRLLDQSHGHFIVITQSFAIIIDLVFLPLLAFSLLNPLGKGVRMIKLLLHYQVDWSIKTLYDCDN